MNENGGDDESNVDEESKQGNMMQNMSA